MATSVSSQLSNVKYKPNKLFRQISIEPPLHVNDECVIHLKTPIMEVPNDGARIRVISAGVCFRRSISEVSRISALGLPSTLSNFETVRLSNETTTTTPTSEVELLRREKKLDSSTLHIPGIKNGSLFAGYEVAGLIEKLGKDVQNNTHDFKVGDRIIVYPYETAPDTYSEYVTVPHLRFLVRIPEEINFNVAAMLPTGALLGMTAAKSACEIIENFNETSKSDTNYKILIVGTGGLSSWTYRFAKYYADKSTFRDRFDLYMACLSADESKFTEDIDINHIIEWQERGRDVHNKVYEEKEIVENTKEKCDGLLHVVINFGTTARTLLRSLRCLKENGAVLISDEFHSVLLPKFLELGNKHKINIFPVSIAGIDSLIDLVKIIASKQVKPPPYKMFEIDEVNKVVQMLCQSQINGRAILKFPPGE